MSSKGIVAVTGASGYIAGWVIGVLIERGYTVRGSVRDVNNEEKTKHLKETFPTLELFEADLLKESSFDDMVAGCTFVIHTASPFQLKVDDPQRDLIDPALQGTLNVLRSAKKANVKRVVVTSSVAAVVQEGIPPADKVWTEADWNSTSTIETNPYRLSKRLAEQAAWKFVKEEAPDMEMATINPALVIGPPKSTRVDATSIKIIRGLLLNQHPEAGVPPTCLGVIDVRDIGKAHVEAMERPIAKGERYILCHPEGVSFLQLVEVLKAMDEFKDRTMPTKVNGEIAFVPKYSAEKATKAFEMTLIPWEQSLRDMAKFLLEHKLV